MKEAFISKKFGADAWRLIDTMEEICSDYETQGYSLSLRQLYYQLVSRNLVENTERSYKRIGSILSDARIAGLIDWDMIVDRGRETTSNSHWSSPADIVAACASQFRYDLWADQKWRVEVMVEKQALEGVLEPVCSRLDISFTANKGYSSSSAMYEAGKRLAQHLDDGKSICIMYLGDHDPSGIDMTRDVWERLALFSGVGAWQADCRSQSFDNDCYYPGGDQSLDDRAQVLLFGDFVDRFRVERLALNMDQIRAYGPPPNPAKVTDARAASYIREHGEESWELDALEPSILARLVEDHVAAYVDADLMAAAIDRQDDARADLRMVAFKMTEENS